LPESHNTTSDNPPNMTSFMAINQAALHRRVGTNITLHFDPPKQQICSATLLKGLNIKQTECVKRVIEARENVFLGGAAGTQP